MCRDGHKPYYTIQERGSFTQDTQRRHHTQKADFCICVYNDQGSTTSMSYHGNESHPAPQLTLTGGSRHPMYVMSEQVKTDF